VGQHLPPQLFKPSGISGGVAHDELNVAVPEIGLNEARVRALIGENKAASMAQHVGMNGHRQLGHLVVFPERQVESGDPRSSTMTVI
jgi:hypothetical protein